MAFQMTQKWREREKEKKGQIKAMILDTKPGNDLFGAFTTATHLVLSLRLTITLYDRRTLTG